MNWTGGRLNRHAKTNQNPALKAQKQHFARAALYNTLHAQDDQSAGSTVDTIPIDSSKPVPQLWQKAEEESKYPREFLFPVSRNLGQLTSYSSQS